MIPTRKTITDWLFAAGETAECLASAVPVRLLAVPRTHDGGGNPDSASERRPGSQNLMKEVRCT